MKSPLQKRLESGKTTITAEIMPPRGTDVSTAIEHGKKLKEYVHAINVTDCSRAIVRMSSLALCKLLKDEGIEPILQMSCRDRNRIGLQADLLGANALGIQNLLCLTGDPVRIGDQPDAKPVNEYDSVRLLEQVASLNNGIDPVLKELPDGSTNLFAGAAADPNCKGFDGLRRRIERKKNAGACFFQTQMVMNPKVLERFCKEIAEPLEIKVLAGVFLLKSAKNADFINRVVPGASIPESIISRLDKASDPFIEGKKIAAEQINDFLSLTQGVHIMAVKAESSIPEILNRANINLKQT
ncbi:methylenetetrahydrofolate reductase [Prochlorococcus sp. MIT 1223]|uniref:methylenetetrahydrofolate reductase n=1 Tax=Prochlorococcus sp. MIT 1223 TaxID=3096217 RepID=UPI002A7478F0|nr:methylenetetrahydrofolate reductase [Prochlorococcus sp. MIT 1223]